MRFIKLITFVLCFSVLLPCGVTASGIGYDDAVETLAVRGISAESAILICSNNMQVIYSKDAKRKLPMASTTKIMTALVIIENCSLDSVVTVDQKAVGVEGSSVYLYKGEKITVKDLLYAVMLESANDAAAALAIHCSGSVDKFAVLMNDTAKSIGMVDTNFTNPHGLDDEEHFSTAHDMALLMSYAMDNEEFRRITSEYKYMSTMKGADETRMFINHNRLLKSYEGCIGGKTGYTKRSGRCLVSVAQRNGIELVCVTLNAPDDWKDHTSMLDTGFDSLESVVLSSSEQYVFDAPVINGKKTTIKAKADEVTAVIEKGNAEDIKTVCEMERFYYAPVKEGEVLGHLVFYSGDEEIARADIKANETIENIKYKKSIWQKILSIFIKD